MIDLYLLCTDLKNPQSNANKVSKGMIQKIYNILRNPSLETEEIFTEWKNDFRYIYRFCSRSFQKIFFKISIWIFILVTNYKGIHKIFLSMSSDCHLQVQINRRFWPCEFNLEVCWSFFPQN